MRQPLTLFIEKTLQLQLNPLFIIPSYPVHTTKRNRIVGRWILC